MTFCSLVSKTETKNVNSHSDVALCKIEELQIQQQCPAFWSAARNEIRYLAKRKKKVNYESSLGDFRSLESFVSF